LRCYFLRCSLLTDRLILFLCRREIGRHPTYLCDDRCDSRGECRGYFRNGVFYSDLFVSLSIDQGEREQANRDQR